MRGRRDLEYVIQSLKISTEAVKLRETKRFINDRIEYNFGTLSNTKIICSKFRNNNNDFKYLKCRLVVRVQDIIVNIS